jgi:hypothetical protein
VSTIVTRAGKGSPLTNTEVDSNFTNLNTDKIQVTGTPTNGQAIIWNGTAWVPGASATYPAAGIANSTGSAWGTSYTTSGSGTVVALATGAALTNPSANQINDTNNAQILGLSPTTSAVDYVTIKNGIGTGVPLHVYADGSSTNIGLHIQPKGSGLVTISDGTDFNKGIRFRSSGSAASAVTLLDAVSTAGRVVTLPDATTTLVGRDTTDTLTNKTLTSPTLTTPVLGTPTSGNFSTGTFTWPTFNQNTTGTAAGLSATLAIGSGGTGQTTANAALNALIPNQATNSGKFLTTDGTNTSWSTTAPAVSLTNDTTTSTNLYPLFAAATTGTASTIYTGNAKLLYKPLTGDLQSTAMVSGNGITINASSVTASYTIAAGTNGFSVGPLTIDSGVTVTVTSGQRHIII